MNQRSTVRRVAASTLIVPAVLLAAACGKADPAPATTSPSQPPAKSAPSASTPPGTSVAPTPSTEAPASGDSIDKTEFVSALKKASSSATSAHVDMTMTVAGQSIKMNGDTKLEGSNASMQMNMNMQGMDLKMLLVDKKVYMKGLPNLPPGKWASFDENSEAGKQMAQAATQADPSRMYDQFENGLTKVEKIGSESVDGEEMTKYALTIDAKKALGDAAATTPGAASLPKTLDYLAWVDGKDHLRKVTFDVAGSKVAMNMSKYGEPVNIKAPAAKNVVKVPGA